MTQMLIEPGDPQHNSRRDLVRLSGTLITAGPLVLTAVAVAGQGFGLSDTADAPWWVYPAEIGVVFAMPAAVVVAAVLTVWRATRPLGQGMLAGLAIGIAGAAVIVVAYRQ